VKSVAYRTPRGGRCKYRQHDMLRAIVTDRGSDGIGAGERTANGRALASAGRLDEALATLLEAAALDPRDAGAHLAIYEVAQILRRPELALEHQRRAIALAPVHSTPAGAKHPDYTLLVPMVPGLFVANTPVDLIVDTDASRCTVGTSTRPEACPPAAVRRRIRSDRRVDGGPAVSAQLTALHRRVRRPGHQPAGSDRAARPRVLRADLRGRARLPRTARRADDAGCATRIDGKRALRVCIVNHRTATRTSSSCWGPCGRLLPPSSESSRPQVTPRQGHPGHRKYRNICTILTEWVQTATLGAPWPPPPTP